MQLAAGSRTAAALALVGAGVVAAAPLAAPRPERPAFELSAGAVDLANPFGGYLDLAQNTFANLTHLVAGIAADPFPLLQQTVFNQVGYLDQLFVDTVIFGAATVNFLAGDAATSLPASLAGAFQELTAGNIVDAGQLLQGAFSTWFTTAVEVPLSGAYSPDLGVVPGVLDIPGQLAGHLQAAVAAATGPSGLYGFQSPFFFNSVLQTLEAPFAAFTHSSQLVVDALGDNNPLAALIAVINMPAVVLDGLLNGFATENTGNLVGLLFDAKFGTVGLVPQLVLHLPQAIATAIGAVDGVPTLPELPAMLLGLLDAGTAGDVLSTVVAAVGGLL